MQLDPHRAANNSPCPETETAALGVGSRHGGHDESACGATFRHNVTAGHRFESRLKLQPIWSDDRCLAGWLTSGEAAVLSQWGRM
jgi:hypothetical protein